MSSAKYKEMISASPRQNPTKHPSIHGNGGRKGEARKKKDIE